MYWTCRGMSRDCEEEEEDAMMEHVTSSSETKVRPSL